MVSRAPGPGQAAMQAPPPVNGVNGPGMSAWPGRPARRAAGSTGLAYRALGGRSTAACRQEHLRHAWPAWLPSEHASPRRPQRTASAAERGADDDQGGDDLFDGHGLFEDLHLVGVALAACGLVPVSFRPTRFCFHPLRSTLGYVLAVTALVCWSGSRLVADRLAVFARRVSLHTRFTSVVCFGSVTGLCLLPLLWVETWRALAAHRRLHRASPCATAQLMGAFGAAFGAWPWRGARSLSRAAVLLLSAFVPPSIAYWLFVMAAEGGSWTHFVLHTHVLALPLLVCAQVAGSALCVKRFADALRAALARELSSARPAARRVRACQRAWLHLRDVTAGLVRTPLTAIAVLLHLLLMSTLAAYQCLVGFIEGQGALAALLFALGSHYYLLLLAVCDAVHRAVQAVGKDFLFPLETYAGIHVPETVRAEVGLFREVVASSRPDVSAAGFWLVTRQTITSILSATLGYVIVLVQFRRPEFPADDGVSRNQSTVAVG